MRSVLFSGLTLFSVCFAAQAHATSRDALLSVGMGSYNITGVHHKVLWQLEYKWKPPVVELRPQAGIFTTEQGATFIYGGVAYDLLIGKHWVITPSFSPGIYFHGGGKHLGFPLEFRSCLELAFRFNNGSRLGGAIYHLSNAHLSSHNPGVNVGILFYSIPL